MMHNHSSVLLKVYLSKFTLAIVFGYIELHSLFHISIIYNLMTRVKT